MDNKIPKLSLSKLLLNDKDTTKTLSNALANHGFFVITDHDIPHKLFDKAYEYSEKFFNLDTTTKNKYSFRHNAGARGYTPFGKETALGETVPDLKEFWHHGPVVDSTYDSRIAKNIQVNEIENFNNVFDELFTQMHSLGLKLLESISLTLVLPESFFYKSTIKGNSLLRLIHYPPSNNENMFRAREHADINLITSIGVLTSCCQLCGLAVEYVDNIRIKWLLHITGWIQFIWAYGIIAHAFFKSIDGSNESGGVKPPSFVYVIVIILFILYSSLDNISVFSIVFVCIITSFL